MASAAIAKRPMVALKEERGKIWQEMAEMDEVEKLMEIEMS